MEILREHHQHDTKGIWKRCRGALGPKRPGPPAMQVRKTWREDQCASVFKEVYVTLFSVHVPPVDIDRALLYHWPA